MLIAVSIIAVHADNLPRTHLIGGQWMNQPRGKGQVPVNMQQQQESLFAQHNPQMPKQWFAQHRDRVQSQQDQPNMPGLKMPRQWFAQHRDRVQFQQDQPNLDQPNMPGLNNQQQQNPQGFGQGQFDMQGVDPQAPFHHIAFRNDQAQQEEQQPPNMQGFNQQAPFHHIAFRNDQAQQGEQQQ